MAVRSFVAFLLALTLSGCWVSEEALFTSNDYAATGLEGSYVSKIDVIQEEGLDKIVMSVEPDRRLKWIATTTRKPQIEGDPPIVREEINFAAFVEIPDTPDGWYLTYGFKSDGEPENVYMLASIDDEGALKLYVPDCAGTEITPGMERLSRAEYSLNICQFKTREALFKAAQKSVEFLTTPQPISIIPFAHYRRAHPGY